MDLWECGLGFMDSQIPLTAEELGVFESMAQGPRYPEDIACEIQIPEDSAQRLLAGT